MAFRIAIAGKGGTGKTTLSALLCGALMRRQVKPLLAVDADPNSCLAEWLGVKTGRTIGQLREELRAHPDKVPAGISKQEWIERLINEEVVESTGLDLIVMGRQEGPDCYCYINNMLRACLEKIGGPYQAVVIDNEAGLEHLSRRTDGKVEVMLVVCQPTITGARTARRIREMMGSLELEVGSACLVLNQCSDSLRESMAAEFAKTGLEILGTIPDDPAVPAFEREQKSMLSLPGDSPAVLAADRLAEELMKRRNG